MDKDDLRRVLLGRALTCVSLASPLLDTGELFIAGSCIATPTINDIDVYPVGDLPLIIPTAGRVPSASKNTTTIKKSADAVPVQFCHAYKKATLEGLVQSFDFSHIQAGVQVSDGKVTAVYWTESYLYATAAGSSAFEGSEYPLSSAIRLLKYHKRGAIGYRASLRAMLAIISTVVNRGFKDYDDFKDQLDAVDLGLGLAPKDIQGMESVLLRLYEALCRNR